ncbi:MAG: hypothetical protein LBR08_08585 [Bacteroidales bacterium]|nr:hypothetical protein [Bacteroidales bacterium]
MVKLVNIFIRHVRIKIFLAATCAAKLLCAAQQTDKAFSGVEAKPYLRSYTQMRAGLHDDTLFFQQEKIMFGVHVRMNEHWSAQMGVDFISMKYPYPKPAFVTWKKERWTVDAGIIMPSQISQANSFWNHRFIERVASDKWMSDPTADLGLRVTRRWNDYLSVDLSVVSGNGFRRLTDRYRPMPAFRLVLTPVEQVEAGGYVSVARNRGVSAVSMYGFVGLQPGEQWKITGEYHRKTNFLFEKDMRLNVASLHASCDLTPWWSMICRYDLIWTDAQGVSGSYRHAGQAWIGGWIFRCFPSLRVSADYRNKRPSGQALRGEDWLYVCLEFTY